METLAVGVEAFPAWDHAGFGVAVESETPHTSDYRLAQRAADGDRSAFEEIYLLYHRRVYAICLHMTHNVAEAEDLTQEVFVHLFRKVGSFRDESSFMTWLHRLTVNRVLMHFRRSGVRMEQTTEDGEMPTQVVHGTENPQRMPIIDRIALNDAISRLAPGYRLAFVLHDVEGYRHEEIAQMLEITVGTSKSQLHLARKKLCKLLRPSSDLCHA